MTDSTADKNASEGAFEVGPSADELFAEIEESFEGEQASREIGDASTGEESIEDRTAADVFAQLRSDVGDDTAEVLSDESPEDIIATADDPDPEPEVDDALLVDEGALEDVLLTERTKDQEFLWIDVDGGAEPTDAAETPAADSESTADDTPRFGADSDDESSESTDDGSAATAFAGDEDAERAVGDEDADVGADTDTDSPIDGDSQGASESPDVGGSPDEADEATVGDSADPAAAAAAPDSDRDAETTAEERDAAESAETSLMVKDDEQALATTDDDEASSGILGWLRSKFGNLL